MNVPLMLAQAGSEHGWLTSRLLGVTLSSAEWVLWLLASLSVFSIALMLERITYFASHGLKDSEALAERLAQGQLEEVRKQVADGKGMEAAVIREGIDAAGLGADSVEQ